MENLEVGNYIRGVNTESSNNTEIIGIVQSICKRSSVSKENESIILLEIQLDKSKNERNKDALKKESIRVNNTFTLNDDDLKYWKFSLIS